MNDLINLVAKFFGYRLVKIDDLREFDDLRAAEQVKQEEVRAEQVKQEQRGQEQAEIAKSASEIKAERARRQVSDAIVVLEDQGSKINIANVSRQSGVARNTAKKYMEELGYR